MCCSLGYVEDRKEVWLYSNSRLALNQTAAIRVHSGIWMRFHSYKKKIVHFSFLKLDPGFCYL